MKFFFLILFLAVPTLAQINSHPVKQTPKAESLLLFAIPVRSIDPTDEDFSDLMPLIDKIGN